jgi:predicted O-methyltransferase YrrM
LKTDVEAIRPPATPSPTAATLSAEIATLLRQIVEETQPRAVLEFGAGDATRVLAEALASIGGGALTCVDDRPDLASSSLDRARAAGNVDLHVIESPIELRLTKNGVIFIYTAAREGILSRGPYDLVFIGAPHGAWGRHCTLPLVYGSLNDRALVVVDEGGRRLTRAMVRRWMKTHGSLQVMKSDRKLGGRGVMVLVRSGRLLRRTSVVCSFWNTWDLVRTWPRRWQARRQGARP